MMTKFQYELEFYNRTAVLGDQPVFTDSIGTEWSHFLTRTFEKQK